MMRPTTSTSLFPQGHATGKAFYNRDNEREQLKNHMLNHEHCTIVAPRRYGKSSLIKQVLLENQIFHRRIDLLPATNTGFVQKAIKNCFSEIINEIAPKTKKAKQKLLELIQEYHPKLTLRLLGQSFEIMTTRTPELDIQDLLLGLDEIAKSVKKHIVICFDEFQQVALLKENHLIEASIRHAAESSCNITYIFSGSIRHLLQQMFNSKARPLYRLCENMEIDRIKQSTYLPILGERAKTKWQQTPDNRMIGEILSLTKCHPYYVNALCRRLWKLEKLPTIHSVQKAWFDYITSQMHWITDDLAKLTPNQRNILAALAHEPTKETYSKTFTHLVNLQNSSVTAALNALLSDDFAYKTDDGFYRVTDPAIESHLLQINFFDTNNH